MTSTPSPQSRRAHYCVCYPRSKAHRMPTNWYCYNHCRFVCDNCVYDELNQRHIKCIVAKYEATEQLKSRHKKNTCPHCNEILPENTFKVFRLNCKCVYHISCLKELLIDSNHTECLRCGQYVDTIAVDPHSNLATSVEKFLKLITSERLFSKKMNLLHKTINVKYDKSPNMNTKSGAKPKPKPKEKRTEVSLNMNPPTPVMVSSNLQLQETRHRIRHTGKSVGKSVEKDKNFMDSSSRSKLKGKTKTYTRTKRVKKRFAYVLVTLAILAQLLFVYLVFFTGTDSTTDGGDSMQGVEMDKNLDDVAVSGSRTRDSQIEDILNVMPKDLKQQIFSANKLQFDQLKNQRISS